MIWLDNLVVPSQAPHRDIAEKFINFILDAKVGAQLSNFNQYATPEQGGARRSSLRRTSPTRRSTRRPR